VERQPGFPAALVPVFVEQDPARRDKLEELKARIRGMQELVTVREYEVSCAGLKIEAALLPVDLTLQARDAIRDGIVTSDEWPRLAATLKRAFEVHGTVALDGLEALGRRNPARLWA